MNPFDSYPGQGRTLLGRLGGSNCRRGYGLKFMQQTGQTTCAYCGANLVGRFEDWLQLALDHVVPRSLANRLGIPANWSEDCINRVLACAACNEFDNRYQGPGNLEPPASLEAFCQLRDQIFMDRRERVAECRQRERHLFFDRRLWEPLRFPNDRAVGDLFRRAIGKQRWSKFAEACGPIYLEAGKEYQLRIQCFFSTADIGVSLEDVDCDRLHEIQILLMLPESDLCSDAVSGGVWLRGLLHEAQARLATVQSSKARLVLDVMPLSGM